VRGRVTRPAPLPIGAPALNSVVSAMDTSQHLIFQSDAFTPVPGEDEETNPGIYGKALSDWLSQALAADGHVVSGTFAEDFGRLIQLQNPGFTLNVVVASTDDTATEWRVFVFAEAGLLARLRGNGAERIAKVQSLFDDFRTILSAESRIRDLRIEN